MSSSFNVSSVSNRYPNHSIANAAHLIIKLPLEILERIASFNDPKDAGNFGLASRHLIRLFSYPPLWHRFFQEVFPDSFAKLNPTMEKSPALYNQLANMKADQLTNMKANKCHIQTLNGHRGSIMCMIPLDNKFISGSFDKTIKVWDLNGQLIHSLEGHCRPIQCMTILNNMLISGSFDKTIKVWDLNGQLIHSLEGHQGNITCMITLNGMLISGSYDTTIMIWDLSNGQLIHALAGHQGGITCMATLDGMLVSGSEDKTVKIWDLSNGQLIQTLAERQGKISYMITLDGKLIYGSEDDTIRIWDLSNRELIQTLTEHQGMITCMIPLGGKLISSSYDSTIKIWDLSNGQLIQTLTGETPILCMTILDGLLISGLYDSTIQIWDLSSGQLIQTLKEHTDLILGIIATLDGKLISGSRDKTIKIWDFNTLSLPSHSKETSPLKQVLKSGGDDLPLFLVDLGVAKDEFSQRFGCSLNHLSEIGICSAEDLQALYSQALPNVVSPDFQYLQITTEAATRDSIELRKRAFDKRASVVALLDQLFAAAQKNSDETKPYTIRRDSDNNVYTVPNPWVVFQEKLIKLKDTLNANGLTEQAFSNKFNPELYAVLIKEVNALINEFHTSCKREMQILVLHAYINQWGILKKWIELKTQGTSSLNAFLKQDTIHKDIFHMGK